MSPHTKEGYEPLFSAWKAADCKMSNRIVMTAPGGVPAFCAGGVAGFAPDWTETGCGSDGKGPGLVFPLAVGARDLAASRPGDEIRERLKAEAAAFHGVGAKVFVRLTTGDCKLRVSSGQADGGSPGFFVRLQSFFLKLRARFSPKANIGAKIGRSAVTDADSASKAFGAAAKLCMELGADGVEVYGMRFGLLFGGRAQWLGSRVCDDNFFSGIRFRLASDIAGEIKAKCGKGFPVGFRYPVMPSASFPMRRGAGSETPARPSRAAGQAFGALERAGYDFIDCDGETRDELRPSVFSPYVSAGLVLDEAEQIAELVKIPVICSCGADPISAARSLASGKVAAVGWFGQFMSDPQWISKLAAGVAEDIRPCAHCGDCLGADCAALTVRAMRGRSVADGLSGLADGRFGGIAVTGDGIGAMEMAFALADNGLDPVIYGSSRESGGAFGKSGSFPFRDVAGELAGWYEREVTRRGIPVISGVGDEKAGVLASRHERTVGVADCEIRVPDVPGLREHSVSDCAFLNGDRKNSDHVIVVGVGLAGLEVAYGLALEGRHPIVVSEPDVFADGGAPVAGTDDLSLDSSGLANILFAMGVQIYAGASLVEVNAASVRVRCLDGKCYDVFADTVVTCAGIVRGVADDGRRIIECAGVRDIARAMRNARGAVRDISVSDAAKDM